MAINIQRLEERVRAAQGTSKATSNDEQMRNIAFGSAGNLSRGSRSKLYSWRDKLGAASGKALAAELTLRAAKGEVFTREEIQRKFITLSTQVELQERQALVTGNINTITLGDFATMLRMCMAKFDKRLSKSLPVTIEMGARNFTLA